MQNTFRIFSSRSPVSTVKGDDLCHCAIMAVMPTSIFNVYNPFENTYVHIRIYMHIRTHSLLHVHIHAYKIIHVYTHIKTYTNIDLGKVIRCYIYIHIHSYTYIHILYTSVYIHILVQNMQEYALPPVCDTDHVDIDKYVSYSKTLEDGTTIYRFSKELLSYLKTLVAFSPYYCADDPRSAGNIDKYYKFTLKLYRDIEYEQFHEYLAGCLKMWYENHPRHRTQRLKAPPAEAAVGDAIDGYAPGLDGAPQKRPRLSMDLVITAPAEANAAAAVGEGAAQSSATTTQATPAAGSPRAAAGATSP
jgi:hypothetical protein